jgi:DNA-binding NarL/FixJ family response regulator
MLRSGLETLVRAHPDLELAITVDSLDEVTPSSADVAVALEAGIDAVPPAGAGPGVLLIWPQVETAQLQMALRAGVRGVLPHDCSSVELTAAIQAVAAGLVVLQQGDVIAQNGLKPQTSTLSPREVEVLRLLADGLANKEIGYRLGISEHTVKFHVNSILTRMDASTRAEAVAIGMRQGLILL